MPAQECPVCHAIPMFAGRTPYCPRCGWQRKQAEHQLRMNLKLAPVAFAILVAIVVGMFFRNSGQQAKGILALFMAIPTALFLVSYLLTRRNLKRLLAQPPPVALVEKSADADAPPTEDQWPPEYQAAMNTPVPRELRLSARGKLNVVMPVVVVAIFEIIIGVHLSSAWAAARSFETFANRDWLALGLALLLLLVPLSIWRTQEKERDLLTNGESALAKVVKQWRDRSNSAIVYEFRDREGREHRVSSIDYSARLCEGRSVPVFYDRDNPKRRIAYCGTSHKIVSAAGATPANQ
jgi:hypothetical protein